MDVFVSSPFTAPFDEVFRAIGYVAQDSGLTAYRVDQGLIAHPINTEIERKIRQSRLVVADLTGNNPNVLHEIGQAQSLGKPLILISQDPPENAPFNVRSLRILHYDLGHLDQLRQVLVPAFSETTSPNETLRSMLVPSSLGHPTQDSRFVIAASPLAYRRVMRRADGYTRMRRTYSDYVGVRGILQAFGLLYGFEALPDLVDPEDHADIVMMEPINLYCIASPKANRWTAMLLEQFRDRWVPHLEFRADPGSKNLKNVAVSLFSHDAMLHPPGWGVNSEGDRHYRDFGLIVRGPNPYRETSMSVVIAGRSSLGTEAACRAFTDTNTIAEIRDRLAGLRIDIEDHRQAFWAIASIHRAAGDGMEEAITNTLTVHQVDRFHRI